MSEYRCPQRIMDGIANGDEAAKSELRAEAIDWLEALDLKPGDTVVLPEPNTGEPLTFRKDEGGGLQ